MTGARQATTADAPAIARTLGAAFEHDPIWRWLLGERAGAGVAAITGSAAGRHPEQFTVSDDLEAVAWWHPPGQWRLTIPETLRLLPEVLPVARFRAIRLLRMSALVESQHPPEPAAYLGYLGAAPASQGQGRGAAALAPALAVCDAFGWPAFLESSNPRNLPFYRRQGFADRPALRVPPGCPVITPMWRAAR